MTGNVQRGPAARKLRDITIARPASPRRCKNQEGPGKMTKVSALPNADTPGNDQPVFQWYRRSRRGWLIAAPWSKGQKIPAPGDVVEVRRKDGQLTHQTIKEVDRPRLLTPGRYQLTCVLQEDGQEGQPFYPGKGGQ